MSSRLVTLTSDIGSVYSAQMKGILLQLHVGAERIVELANDLPAHRIGEAAFLFRHMAADVPGGDRPRRGRRPGRRWRGPRRGPIRSEPAWSVRTTASSSRSLATSVWRASCGCPRGGAARSLGQPDVRGPGPVRPGRGRIALGTPISRLGDP